MENITVNEIEFYFAETGTPDFVVQLDKGCTLRPENANKFLNNVIQTIIAHPENSNYDAYYSLLVKYYQKVKKVRAILSKSKHSN